jgi:2-polyprenyl-3-methyl-5-hydroxy-6-metoxy-1,4-benzoquinol methylase
MLEVGCGHGLFAALLATTSPAREVVGVDVDGTKIHAAQRAAVRSGARLTFAPAPPGELPDGPWDAVAIVDVLYLIDRPGQEALLRRLAGDLAPGGVLLNKEMALSPGWKFRWMRFQERLAVKVLGITEGSELTFVPPADVGEWLRDAGLEVEHRRLDRRYPHPHHLIVARRP